MTLWMITASATDDGAPTYLQANGQWTRRLAEGWAIDRDGQRDEALIAARGQERVVCDPYPIEVRRDATGEPAPTSLRERIRAEGPTITLPSARVAQPWRDQASA